MAAKLGGFLVRLDDHRRGVPADVAPDVLLELAVAWMGGLVLGRNGVDVSGVGGERQLRADTTGGGDDRIQNVVDLGDSLEGFDRIERVEPFASFVGLVLDPVVHRADLPIAYTKVVSALAQSSDASVQLAIAADSAAAMSILHVESTLADVGLWR